MGDAKNANQFCNTILNTYTKYNATMQIYKLNNLFIGRLYFHFFLGQLADSQMLTNK